MTAKAHEIGGCVGGFTGYLRFETPNFAERPGEWRFRTSRCGRPRRPKNHTSSRTVAASTFSSKPTAQGFGSSSTASTAKSARCPLGLIRWFHSRRCEKCGIPPRSFFSRGLIPPPKRRRIVQRPCSPPATRSVSWHRSSSRFSRISGWHLSRWTNIGGYSRFSRIRSLIGPSQK